MAASVSIVFTALPRTSSSSHAVPCTAPAHWPARAFPEALRESLQHGVASPAGMLGPARDCLASFRVAHSYHAYRVRQA